MKLDCFKEGITKITKHNDTVIIGSYDCCFRTFDSDLKGPVQEENTGKSIWDFSILDNTYLTASIYDGLIQYDSSFKEKANLTEGHDSIVYGIDIHPQNRLVASCSFYDNKIKIMKY